MKKILVIAASASLLYACKPTQVVNLPEVNVQSKKEIQTTPKNYFATYTRKIDIIHTKLNIHLNWDSCFVIGKANIKATPYFYKLNEIELDAKGFKINEIKINNKKADYSYDNYKLKIKLDKTYQKNESFDIYVDYIAMPNKIKVQGSAAITSDKGFYFINPDGKNKNIPQQFWTQGETEANSCWFPTIESGSERFSQEIAITVKDEWVTLSNGRLAYSTKNSDGTRIDVWKQDLSHAPYLVMLAGGNFKIYKDKWRDMEVNYYMEPEFAPYAKQIFGNTPEMIEFFSKKLGYTYPWDKYSQIVVREFVSGAMENTSAVTFFDDMNMTDRDLLDNTNEEIISHELFHHWFGDLVTCESWPNLPLNESFATYGEYLWNEYKYGRYEADKSGHNDLNVYLQTAKTNRVDLIRFNLTDREEMFDANSYQKGGRILHMLRKYVGDDAFFTAISKYLNTYQYKPVEVHHLRLVFEEVTGEDLNWFFNQWFLSSGHAELEINYDYNADKKQAMVQLKQVQDLSKNPIYKLPLDIDIYSNNKVERKRIILDSISQNFYFDVEVKPNLINVDAEKALVGTKTDNHSKDEWLYMFHNAPLFLDRLESINALNNYKSDSLVQLAFMKALDDSINSIRIIALSRVKELNTTNKKSIYNKIKLMALNDDKSNVRARAAKVLDESYKSENNTEVFEKLSNDQSYYVVSTILKIYSTTDSAKAAAIARKELNTHNFNMLTSIAEFYSKGNDQSYNQFYISALEKASGYNYIYILPFYKNYLKKTNDATILSALPTLRNIGASTTLAFVQSTLKQTLKELYNTAKDENLKSEIQKEIDKLEKK